MVLEAQLAQAVVAGIKERPTGAVRFSCLSEMLETVTPILASFLAAYPDVSLDVVTSNTPTDLIEHRPTSHSAFGFRSTATQASPCARWQIVGAFSSPCL
jgi:DNA-binding transcriptional LysR family regulator